MVARGRRVLPGAGSGRLLLVSVLLLVLAGLLLLPTGRGLTVSEGRAGPDGDLPVRIYVPDGVAPGSAPGVVVAHGFAGSAALMHTWSLALTHAGFVVVAPDLPGHGRNTSSLAGRDDVLADAVGAALDHLRGVPEVDAARVALLGHSMGSGAVLTAGIARHGTVRAVIAVSPTDAAVTPAAPRDLLLLAGENEARFVRSAESLLERAGGARGAPGDGDARALLVVPRVEHVSILFSRTAHEASIAWLAAALAHERTGEAPAGPLLGWLLLVLGSILAWRAFLAQAATPAPAPDIRPAGWIALPAGGVAATASLVIIERSVDVAQLTGVLVAGQVGLWFLMAGAVWLRFGIRPGPPEPRDLGWAGLTTIALVVLGASSTLAWAPWWLDGDRVTTAVLLGALLLPFTLAAGATLHGRRGRATVLAWAGTSAAVVLALGAAAVVIPSMSFLVLILPLLPVVLAATTAVTAGVERPWATGIATAVLLGWLLAMLFPLA